METPTTLKVDILQRSLTDCMFSPGASLVTSKNIFDTEILVNGVRKGLADCNNELNQGYENCANTAPLVLKS